MSLNLRDRLPSSTTLLVHDTNQSAVSSFCREERPHASDGAQVRSSSVAEIAESSLLVLTMLPSTSHVSDIYLSQFPSRSTRSNRDRLLIDCSTIDPDASKDIASQYLASDSGTFLDAPVSGGVAGARQGTLSFMVGCRGGTSHDGDGIKQTQSDGNALASRVTEVLRTMGRTIHFCGDRGDGLRAKLINNYLLALTNLATCEAMRLGVKLGVAPEILGSVVNSSTGTCWPSSKNNPVLGITPGAPVERDYEGGFSIELMMKDLGLAIDMAKRQGVTLPSAEAAMKTYTDASRVYAGKDFGVVMRYFESLE